MTYLKWSLFFVSFIFFNPPISNSVFWGGVLWLILGSGLVLWHMIAADGPAFKTTVEIREFFNEKPKAP